MSRLAELRARYAEHKAALDRSLGAHVPSLEALLTDPRYFALVTATPLQRAIARIADGRPLGALTDHPDVVWAIGDTSAIRPVPPAELLLLAGIRGGKSLLAAAGGLRMALTCDVSRLGPGEIPRVPIVSLKLDLSQVVYRHLVGALKTQPALAGYLIGEPTADTIVVRHPSGRPVEIKTVAGARAGGSLVARWLAGLIFDEAPRMVGASDGVVNLDDMRTSVLGRMLPGTSIWYVGSPWAPFGPIHEMTTEHWRAPTSRLVVIRARAPMLNPVWWTPERIAALRESDPNAAKTDVDTEFADPEEALIPTATIEACTAPEEGPQPGHEYVAAIDPATRGNAWTLAIGTRRDGKRRVVRVREWIGSKVKPLDPDEVFRDIAAEVSPYRIERLETDQWSTDALRGSAGRAGLSLDEWALTGPENTEGYLELARRMSLSEVIVPAAVKTDLQRVRKKVTQNGVTIVLPLTADGRHCDFAPVVMRVVRRYVDEPKAPEKPADQEQREVLERMKDRWASKEKRVPWGRR